MKRVCILAASTMLLSSAAPSLTQTTPPETTAVAGCTTIAHFDLPDVAITSSTAVPAGNAWAQGAPMRGPAPSVAQPFCRVVGKINGTINFELWLPYKAAWNGKYVGAGVGGAAGTFNFSDLPRVVSRGYAAATTDTGHKITDAAWMLDKTARDNYTHLANHLLAVKSKEIVARFYSRAPAHSYFIGCSGGGRQALKELQRYPDDYDGIISGANGPQTPEMTARRMWEILQRDSRPDLMKPADWKLVADAGRKSCDAADGHVDDIVEDPRHCSFKVASLQCTPGQSHDCLSGEQVAFAEKFYAPLRGADGRAIDEGILPGVLIDSGRSQLAPATFGQGVRGLPNWNGEGFEVGKDLAAVNRVMPDLRADDTDLSRFRKRGGKLLMYSGYADSAVAARMVIAYHEAVVRRAGGPAAARFERLYMIPDMYHCGGGPGSDQIGGSGRDAPVADARHDLLKALEEWVEQGRAPAEMVASRVENGAVTRTHLICPYPARAVFVGGNAQTSTAFRCEAPPARR